MEGGPGVRLVEDQGSGAEQSCALVHKRCDDRNRSLDFLDSPLDSIERR
jgi:hypothetical protein